MILMFQKKPLEYLTDAHFCHLLEGPVMHVAYGILMITKFEVTTKKKVLSVSHFRFTGIVSKFKEQIKIWLSVDRELNVENFAFQSNWKVISIDVIH